MVAADLARVAAGASLGVRLRQVGREVVEALKPKDIEAWGVRYSPAYAKVLETPDRDQLVALLHQVLAVLRHDHTGLVLMYDEFHEVWDGRYRGQGPARHPSRCDQGGPAGIAAGGAGGLRPASTAPPAAQEPQLPGARHRRPAH